MFSRQETPFGRSWEEWTAKWWQWFLTIPIIEHPAYDKTGEKAGINQFDPNVWFIAGTTGGKAERAIFIPPGKAILFPVINVTTSYSENPSLKTIADLELFVNDQMNDIARKEVIIDGEQILVSEMYRVKSPEFQFSFPPDNIYGVQAGQTTGVGEGYWIFLRVLSPGKHTIKTAGACMSGRIQISVDIELTVSDRSF